MKYETVNPLSKLREDEPFFFLRSQDKLAPLAVQAYADALNSEANRLFESDPETAKRLMCDAIQVLKFATRMVDWQLDNQQFVKLPD
jgi:hypothetical protein